MFLLFCRMASSSAKPTRLQKLVEAAYTAHSTIAALDRHFNLFRPSVHKVVDLGFAPGHWLTYARDALLHVHGVATERIADKCTLIGLDLLFAQPPAGTICTQGNVFSESAHRAVVELLQDAAMRRLRALSEPELYIQKEAAETELESEVSHLTRAFGDLAVADPLHKLMGPKMYQADVVLADLGAPFLQELGFFNNTHSRPYIRGSRLRVPEKGAIDMAEAALLLCCTALGKNGTFVVRLARVDLADPELGLLERRLDKVFANVTRWPSKPPVGIDDLYFVCENKRDYMADKYEVFDVKRGSEDE